MTFGSGAIPGSHPCADIDRQGFTIGHGRNRFWKVVQAPGCPVNAVKLPLSGMN